ncbi:sugar phosphate isomerase/epimerase family protein [Natronoflexus pectinivorans]|uniref:Sugar phosphate isomerase/epimerase n=1 Tax=Natronoflexus pectinivorans TaxID=682526 RepID=A0A4R2GJS5_9BACT|nr:sugar phosphate isomerase/epimerase [Natronoflexus pectinivorans]TCO08705.1 sugar phosphate isomerase/epimerase [Natronoflexus pectinivorans]
MKIKNRREFIKTTSLGVLGAALLSKYGMSACASPQAPAAVKSGIGIQLYTIRDEMNQDVAGTLKRVADIGYQYLELAGYNNGKFYGYSPAEFKNLVNDLGMEIISSHTGVEVKGVDTSNVDIMAEAHAELGVKYCVQPWLVEERRVSADSYRQFVEELNIIGEVFKRYGIRFAYHNHDFEFFEVDGLIPYTDIFLKEGNPDLLTFELDHYWVARAGFNSVDLMKQFPGRFELWHIKDMEDSEDQFFAPVGEGIIDYKAIMEVADVAGMKYFFVEQDATRDGRAMEAIETSFKNMQNKILI